jgi:hypothetical protein
MWHLNQYFTAIEETQSVFEAYKKVDNVYAAGFMKESLMGDSPIVSGGSVHEGGFMAELNWDDKQKVFRSKTDGRNSITDEPFKIEIVSDSLMKFVFESDSPDRLYRKMNGDDNAVEKTINDILFAGTYKLPDGETVTFSSEGKILNYGGYSEMSYEVVQDFFELGMDALEVSLNDGSTQLFHYEINESGFRLFDIYGEDPGSFQKGDLVNEFTEAGKVHSSEAESKEEDIEVSSNYFDLPQKHRDDLKAVLDTENLDKLGSESLEEMKDYLNRTVLGGRSQFGPNIESNYFWFVYNALPDFVSKKERHRGYYKDQNEQDLREKLLAYAMYRLDRSPENIERLYHYARPVIKERLPGADDIDRKGIHQKVNQLLSAYDYIVEIDNYKEKLSDAYMAADTMTGTFIDINGKIEFRKFENSAYGFSVYELNEFVMKHLKPDIDRFHSMPVDLSFWMRRNKEGNMEMVHSILVEIQEMM